MLGGNYRHRSQLAAITPYSFFATMGGPRTCCADARAAPLARDTQRAARRERKPAQQPPTQRHDNATHTHRLTFLTIHDNIAFLHVLFTQRNTLLQLVLLVLLMWLLLPPLRWRPSPAMLQPITLPHTASVSCMHHNTALTTNNCT